MSTITEREADMFTRWKSERNYQSFVKDGVFDEKTWSGETLKITFVLKDPNWPGGSGDLRENLRNHSSEGHWKTWDNIARWAQALLKGGEFHVARFTHEERWALLRRISAMNIKKVGGGGSVRDSVIREYAKQDWEFLQEQLCLYLPDIVVCCGPVVWKALSRDIFPPAKLPVQDWEDGGEWKCFYTKFPPKERLTPVLCFRHPQMRCSKETVPALFRQVKDVRALLLPPEL